MATSNTNLWGVGLITVGLLLIDSAIHARSPLDTAKAILTGQSIPAPGSAKGADSSSGDTNAKNNGGVLNGLGVPGVGGGTSSKDPLLPRPPGVNIPGIPVPNPPFGLPHP